MSDIKASRRWFVTGNSKVVIFGPFSLTLGAYFFQKGLMFQPIYFLLFITIEKFLEHLKAMEECVNVLYLITTTTPPPSDQQVVATSTSLPLTSILSSFLPCSVKFFLLSLTLQRCSFLRTYPPCSFA